MNPSSPPPQWFGRTAAQAVGGATLLAVLGAGAIISAERFLTRPGTPVGDAFRSTGLPPTLPLILGVTAVVLIAANAAWTSLRVAPRFRLGKSGLEVQSAIGRYRFDWDNLAEVGVTATGALGIRVTDRAALLATHEGTPQQHEWLRTMAPYGEWDFLFQQAELGYPAEQVLQWIRQALEERKGGSS